MMWESFFSSPIDNQDIWKDYGRSDDDQRHRVVLDASVHNHGFQLSGFLQGYSALPLNITTGSNTLQGTAARPLVNRAFISRNAGVGANFVNLSTRLSRTFPLGERVRLEALAEAFNVLNHRNDLTRNGVFGSGAYPFNPSATFGQITAVNDPRVLQFAVKIKY